jgi:membrane-associated phospholipid phosphatase
MGYGRFALLILATVSALAKRDCEQIKKDSILIYWHDRKCKKYHVLKDWVRDLADMNRRLFTPRVLRPVLMSLPVYFAVKETDEKVNCVFYDKNLHKNLSTLPDCVTDYVSKSVAVTAVAFSAIQLFTRRPDLKLTSDIFSKGAFSIWLTKNLIKNTVRVKICQRPKNACFNQNCIYYGGFPSGHMGIATYMATFFWMRQGPKWGLPLTVYASTIFGAALSGNRHYASQLVGGAMLGLAFAFASREMIKAKVGSYVECNPKFDGNRVGVEISYPF